MKLHSLRLNDTVFKVVSNDIFSTNDELKAMVVLEPEDLNADFKSTTYSNYEIKGIHFDYSELLINGEISNDLYIDFVAGSGDWHLAYIYIDSL